MTRQCCVCKQVKLMSEYYRDTHHAGHRYSCKECDKARQARIVRKRKTVCLRCRESLPRAQFEKHTRICLACRPSKNGHKAPVVMGNGRELKPPGGGANICSRCPGLQMCNQRVKHGLWVLCEIPDKWDRLFVESWVPVDVQETLLTDAVAKIQEMNTY